MPLFSSSDTLLATAARPAGRRLLFGRLKLRKGSLELRGLTLRGPYRRTIPLHEIERVDWEAMGPVNLVLVLKDGAPFPLEVKAPGLWKFTLQEHLPRLRTASAKARPALPSAA